MKNREIEIENDRRRQNLVLNLYNHFEKYKKDGNDMLSTCIINILTEKQIKQLLNCHLDLPEGFYEQDGPYTKEKWGTVMSTEETIEQFNKYWGKA